MGLTDQVDDTVLHNGGQGGGGVGGQEGEGTLLDVSHVLAAHVLQEGAAVLLRLQGKSAVFQVFHVVFLLMFLDDVAGHDAGGDVGAELLASLDLVHNLLALLSQFGHFSLQLGQSLAGGAVDLGVDSSQSGVDFVKSHG